MFWGTPLSSTLRPPRVTLISFRYLVPPRWSPKGLTELAAHCLPGPPPRGSDSVDLRYVLKKKNPRFLTVTSENSEAPGSPADNGKTTILKPPNRWRQQVGFLQGPPTHTFPGYLLEESIDCPVLAAEELEPSNSLSSPDPRLPNETWVNSLHVQTAARAGKGRPVKPPLFCAERCPSVRRA